MFLSSGIKFMTKALSAKLNIFIKGLELKTENLKVSSFCQSFENNSMWVNKKINVENNIEIENAILNKAKKIKLSLN